MTVRLLEYLSKTQHTSIFLTLLLFLFAQSELLAHGTRFHLGLCLYDCLDRVISNSAFHYWFSLSPPPIIPVTSDSILVVLWGSTTARKPSDHCGTSSRGLHCVFIPSVQSCTAAQHIIHCMMWLKRWKDYIKLRLHMDMIMCSLVAHVLAL